MGNPEKGLGVPQQKTPEEIKKLEQQRQQYEKTVNQDADSSLKQFIKNILGKSSVTVKDIMFSDAEHEDELRSEVEVGDANNVNEPVLNVKNRWGGPMSYPKLWATGYIDGKKVEIIQHYTGDLYPSARIEGADVGTEDAKAIYEKYFAAALERSDKIERLKNQGPTEEELAQEKIKDVLK
jgi:hypothetical protein